MTTLKRDLFNPDSADKAREALRARFEGEFFEGFHDLCRALQDDREARELAGVLVEMQKLVELNRDALRQMAELDARAQIQAAIDKLIRDLAKWSQFHAAAVQDEMAGVALPGWNRPAVWLTRCERGVRALRVLYDQLGYLTAVISYH